MITHKTFWLWFGGIWLFVGAPFFVLGLYFGYHHATVTQRLDAGGTTVDGMVLTKSRKTSSSNKGGNRSTTYEVTFRFLTRDAVMKGSAEVTDERWDQLVERELLPVTYLPEAPQHYRIDGQTNGWWLPGAFTVIGGVFGGLGVFILLRARGRILTDRRLQREGVPATAIISEVSESTMRINGVRQWAIHYEYRDERGVPYTGKESFSPEEAMRWKEGDRVTIRYDRRRPDRSLWVGS